MRTTLTTLILFASCPVIAADSAIQCLQYFNDAEYDKAVSICQHAADVGNAACQSVLGEMYDAGLGVEPNPVLASRWWHAASSQGYLPAHNLLASKYYYGGDVFGQQPGWDQDYQKAYELWQQSAYKGVATSQFMLGVLLMDGQGVDRDYIEAYAWFQLALQSGYKMATDAMIELSRLISAEQKSGAITRANELKAQIKPLKTTDQ